MTFTFPRVLLAARALFRRDREIILTLIGAFVFLPTLALRLLTDPIPVPAEAAGREESMRQWLDAVALWGQGNAGWHILADVVALIGLAALAALMVAPDRPDVRGALRFATQRFARLALASVLVSFAINAGLWVLLVPGLWMQARTLPLLAVLAAEPQRSAIDAIRRTTAVTRGHGIALLGAVAALFLAQWLAMSPLEAFDRYLREPAHLNPFVLAMVDVLLAAVSTAWRTALLLCGVVVYRLRASIGT